LFFYRIPWTIALRGLIDAPWYEETKTPGNPGEPIEIDCENITDDDINAIQNLAKKR
jgi:hypothetical protein